MLSRSMRRVLQAPKTLSSSAAVVAYHRPAVMVGFYNTTNTMISQYSTSKKLENSLIIGGIAVAASAATLKYALVAYQNYEANKPAPGSAPEGSDATSATADATAKASATEEATAKASEAASATKKKKGDTAGQQAAKQADSLFASFFARNFYDGGFEDKMTKREAALILGIRESATVEKVKEAHRRVLLLNHPDRGGSAFIAAKINEAKDLLIKGRV